MDARLNRRFPSVHEMELAAIRRMPKFIADYVRCGIGRQQGVLHNRETLDAVKMMPRYLVDADDPDLSTTLFGDRYDAAFGIAPVGNGGSVWPGAADHLAVEAKRRRQPFTVSTVSVTSLEDLRMAAGDMAWFQLYRPNVPEIEEDLVRRVKAAGYKVLMVTVDVPGPLRRDHDLKNNFGADFSFFDPATMLALMRSPRWSLEMALGGFPQFENLLSYAPQGNSKAEQMKFILNLITGHVTLPALERLRGLWDGVLLAKGVLDPEEAKRCQEIGLDGIVVSNHGGRQLEAAPNAPEVLPAIRRTVGPDFALIADGGVRTGMDICRMLALGADFVLMGRAFYYAMGAIGRRGAPHVFDVLRAETTGTMRQLGARTIADLPGRLYP